MSSGIFIVKPKKAISFFLFYHGKPSYFRSSPNMCIIFYLNAVTHVSDANYDDVAHPNHLKAIFLEAFKNSFVKVSKSLFFLNLKSIGATPNSLVFTYTFIPNSHTFYMCILFLPPNMPFPYNIPSLSSSINFPLSFNSIFRWQKTQDVLLHSNQLASNPMSNILLDLFALLNGRSQILKNSTSRNNLY